MNNSICGENVESDHASLPGGRLDGDVLPPGDIDLLTPGSLQGGRALGHFFGLESSTRDNMIHCQDLSFVHCRTISPQVTGLYVLFIPSVPMISTGFISSPHNSGQASTTVTK